jgi:hypothetical protein
LQNGVYRVADFACCCARLDLHTTNTTLATDVFDNYHSAKVYRRMLPAYYVGEVTDVEVWPHVADFRAARQELLRRGLFETDYRFYGSYHHHTAQLACTPFSFFAA